MNKNSYEINMTTGPIIKNVLLFALPLLFTGILQLAYNAVDIIVIGQYSGKEALAAVGSTSAIINLLITMLIGLSVGTSVTIANQFGADDLQGMNKTAQTSIAISLIAGVTVGLLGILTAKPLLLMMGSPPDVIELAATYMRIYFAGMPATMLYTFAGAIMRALGDTKRPMIYLAISGVLNVALNLLFVIVFHLSVAGVALATVISTVLSAIMIMRSLMSANGKIYVYWRKLSVNWQALKQITHIGLPAGFESAMFSISNVLLQSTINSFGSVVMAGTAISSSIEGFGFVALNCITQASLTFVSQNRGAGQYERIRRSMSNFMFLIIVVGIGIGVLANLFGEKFISVYNGEADVIASGMIRMRVVLSAYFTMGIMNVLSAQIRGLGNSLLPMIVSVSGICVFRLIWLYIVFPQQPTLQILFLSYPISWTLTALIHFICYRYVLRALPMENCLVAE